MKHTTFRSIAPLLAALFIFVALAVASAPAHADDAPLPYRWELYAMPSDSQDALLAVLWITPPAGTHAYGNPAGDTGLPTTLTMAVEGEEPLPAFYPPGDKQNDIYDPTKTVFVYEHETPIFMPIPAQVAEHADAPLSGRLSALLCSEINCRPINTDITLDLGEAAPADLPSAKNAVWWPLYISLAQGGAPAAGDIAAPSPVLSLTGDTEPAPAPEFQPRYFSPGLEVTSIGKALIFAFIAGFILNFMPCVLPVVSLKVSALLGGAGAENEAQRIHAFREHNVFFSLGILLYFGFLAAVLSALGLAWGQLFQQPGLVLGATAVVFALSLSLFGVFDLPVVDLKTTNPSGNPRMQAMFTGILATLLATPCSGPFLGGVLGWVLLQPPLVIASVFLCIGLGMSSPFLLMALRPGLATHFPRPGGWMRYLEAGVGLFLMATCVYLLSIIPEAWLISALALLWVVAVAAWMWGKWTNLSQSRVKRWSIRSVAVALVLIAWPLLMRPAAPNPWLGYTPAAFESALGETPIVLDFTADWCPNCKALEKTTLTNDNLTRWTEEWDVSFMQADLTESNPEAMALLRSLGSQSIPVVAIFPAGKDATRPVVLRDIFTESQMDAALAEALGAP